MMTPFYPLEKLHQIPGFAHARYEDPYAGSKGNSMRYFAMCRRTNALQVIGMDNLFCAGEKAGPLVGHTEAIVTGVLAGYNAVQYLQKMDLLILPRELAVGDAIAYVHDEMSTSEGISKKYTFSGSVYFERMKELGLYQIDPEDVLNKINLLHLNNIFSPQ